MTKYISTIAIAVLFATASLAQTGNISGSVLADGLALEYVNITIDDHPVGGITDKEGKFSIEDVPYGEFEISASFLGYETQTRHIHLDEDSKDIHLEFKMSSSNVFLNQVVVTGTKTFKRKTDSPVIVNVINSESLDNVQACNLSEGLKFQTGLRVETDCQTCNYTQLRMNGLAGGYAQILINGRPIFSPLTGLYGLEQIPVNMIERIETVRGGGSSLYGSSAIGGTVNVITKIPSESAYDINYTFQNINGKAQDKLLSGNATVLSHNGNAGASFFINNRQRDYYDHNGDNFSELPELKNSSFGTNLFLLPGKNQKIEVSLSRLHEYRYGGEMVEGPAHLALQSEERTHDVLMGSLDYQINFNQDRTSFIAFFAGQHTDRDHYTGIFPDDTEEIQSHLSNPPYGFSNTLTLQGGTQINHSLKNFLGGSNVLTAGAEYVMDEVLDVIDSYNYKIDQTTKNLGVFLQSDWEILPSLNLLSGVRADRHNLLDKTIFSPRFSFLYKLKSATQFRLSWSTGFRAPQAFDTDLHIAFAGGGISRISLSPDLKEERSKSISGSVNYDKVEEKYIAGFTLEGFYTNLNDAFYQHPIGEDEFGERFEKRNGDGATVKGITLELRANYNQKIQLETGFTFQSSQYGTPVENIEGLAATRKFLRTPDQYGFATLSIMPTKKFNTSINLVYTGSMQIAHFAGAPNQEIDEYVISKPFTEIGFKTGYTFTLDRLDSGLEVFGGIKNILNAYQNDFDIGKNRDSNFVYGPGAPRTFFVGIRLKSF